MQLFFVFFFFYHFLPFFYHFFTKHTVTYDEVLLKFTKSDEMDVTKAGHKAKKKFKPGFANHRVNLERVKRRRERDIASKQKIEEKKRLRSARIRKNLRQAFEDRLANRINLGAYRSEILFLIIVIISSFLFFFFFFFKNVLFSYY